MTRLLRFVLCVALVAGYLAPLAVSANAWAQKAPAEPVGVTRAREYFRAGAQAYSVGAYAAAVQAFEQAYELAPRPAVLFSIAQAERRLYFLGHERAHLEKALRLYRDYLAQEQEAARRSDAIQAITELEPLLLKAPSTEAPSSATPSPEPPAPPTRVMVTSPAEGASISIDGGKPHPSPLIGEVLPGEHWAEITAPGYVSDKRRLLALQGSLVTFDISLAEQPAKLHVMAPDGAELSIDGRLQGTCPFPKPLEITAGKHLITITDRGYEPWSEERILERGKTTTIMAQLPRTLQRTTSLLMFGASASAMTASLICTGFALVQQSYAKSFLEQRGRSNLSPADLAEYESVRKDRDNLRLGALFSAGAAFGLAATGALLFNYDAKIPQAPLKAPPQKSRGLSATPMLAPGMAGLSLRQEF